MTWRQRLFGPSDTRPFLQQLSDTWDFAHTGVDPRAQRAATEAYGYGFQHGASGIPPLLPAPAEWTVPQPQRSPLMQRVLGPAPSRVPVASEVDRLLQWARSGETPQIQSATQAGYFTGWMDAQYRQPPQTSVELTTLQKIKLRM